LRFLLSNGRRVASLVLIGAAALGCGSGGVGDPVTKPHASELGDGARLSDLITAPNWVKLDDPDSTTCATPRDRPAHVTGVTITTIDTFDETGKGARGDIYIQDHEPAPRPYSGTKVFGPSFSPPDLRLAVGDVVDVLGVFQEFPGTSTGPFPYCRTLPELGGTMSLRFENGMAEPKVLTALDLKSYEAARPWLGMIVRLEDVRILANPNGSNGRYTAAIDVGAELAATDGVPELSNELYDLEKEGPALAKGTVFQSVTGIVTYFYGVRLAPRSPADFEE
jgi:hypothetical protein